MPRRGTLTRGKLCGCAESMRASLLKSGRALRTARQLCTARQRLAINTAQSRLLHEDPPIYVNDDFLPARMCERICAAAEPLLKPSTVFHMDEEERDTAGIRSGGGRDSSSAYLHHRSVPALLARAEALLGRPRTYFEFPQV